MNSGESLDIIRLKGIKWDVGGNMELRKRNLENVIKFYEESKDETLRMLFPFQNNTLEESIRLFEQSEEANSKSYGRTIYHENKYIGDVWCYGVDEEIDESGFISIVIFDKNEWGMGLGKAALNEFNNIISKRYNIKKICAFTFKSNISSIKTLESVGFNCKEEFVEDGIESLYFEKKITTS